MARPMQSASRRSSTADVSSATTARKRPREEEEEGSASQEAEDRWVAGWLASYKMRFLIIFCGLARCQIRSRRGILSFLLPAHHIYYTCTHTAAAPTRSKTSTRATRSPRRVSGRSRRWTWTSKCLDLSVELPPIIDFSFNP